MSGQSAKSSFKGGRLQLPLHRHKHSASKTVLKSETNGYVVDLDSNR